MVCARCIKTVTGIFQQAGAEIKNVKLGTVETINQLDPDQLNTIRKNLINEGFELLDDQKMKLIEQIKNEIINLVHYGDLDELTINLSTLLSKKLLKDYNISVVFTGFSIKPPSVAITWKIFPLKDNRRYLALDALTNRHLSV